MASTTLRAVSVALFGLSFLSSVQAFTATFPYGTEKVRGVNLGGWLVLEPWITPSLFEATGDDRIIDEYTFGQYQDADVAKAALKAHWKSWITEDDFADIAAAGLNHVRLPIGYWAFDVSGGEPYIQGQKTYLTKAIGWAATYGLKVIVDLHGVPGSQNGFDNSGQKMAFPSWQEKQANIDRSNAIIKTLASLYKDNPAVVIQALNEPAGFDGDAILSVTKQFYYDSYGNVRYPYGSATQSNNLLVVHDAFQSLDYWSAFGVSPTSMDGVAMDTHIYQIFSDAENQRSHDEHIANACANADRLSSFHLWTVVGEWTPAMSDCAKWLNGRGVGSRYDGTYPGSSKIHTCTGRSGSASTFSQDYKKFLRKSWEAQVITYEKGAGWIMWTWKTESTAEEWSYKVGLENHWIPKDPTNYKHPDICG